MARTGTAQTCRHSPFGLKAVTDAHAAAKMKGKTMDKPADYGGKPVKKRKRKPIYVWVVAEERATIAALAKLHGLSMSSFLRLTGMGYTIPSPADREEVDEIVKIVADLSRLGGLQKWCLKAIGDGDMAAVEGIKSVHADIRQVIGQLKTHATRLLTPRINDSVMDDAPAEEWEESDDDL